MKNGFFGRITLALVPLVLGTLVLPPAGSAQEEHRVRGDEVAVYNLAGAVEIVPGSGGEMIVQVMRGGKDAQQLEIDGRIGEGGVRLFLQVKQVVGKVELHFVIAEHVTVLTAVTEYVHHGLFRGQRRGGFVGNDVVVIHGDILSGWSGSAGKLYRLDDAG